MSIPDHRKLDVLWKKFYGVAPTSDDKSAHNEHYTNTDPTFQKNFWTDSDLIPTPAPTVETPVGNEVWIETIQSRIGINAVFMKADPTTNNSAWHALTDQGNQINQNIPDQAKITNWVPPTFDRSYTIKVWGANPNGQGPNAQRLMPFTDGFEWIFDYVKGILYFPNGVPPIALASGIWIEGWSYTGNIGRDGSGDPTSNTAKIRTFVYDTVVLPVGGYDDFVFATGGKCILVEAQLTNVGILECHATADRIDTNPYRFLAIQTHLVDDGSYSVVGQRYYGERFVPLVNMGDPASNNTYWRVYNTDSVPRFITVIVKVA